MLRHVPLCALLLPGCFDSWEIEHREPIAITLDDVESGLRVAVDDDSVVLSVQIERDEDECFYVSSLHVKLDGVEGDAVNGGGWSQTSVGNPEQCFAPRATFKLPTSGRASFVASSGDPGVMTTLAMDVELRAQPFTWADSTRVYHPGDVVTIDVPSLSAEQNPTVVIYSGSNAQLGVQIDAAHIVRDGIEARFEIPELPSVSTPTTATMDVFAMVSPTVVRCDAAKGCGATPFKQTLSASISLAP